MAERVAKRVLLQSPALFVMARAELIQFKELLSGKCRRRLSATTVTEAVKLSTTPAIHVQERDEFAIRLKKRLKYLPVLMTVRYCRFAAAAMPV